MLDDLLQPDPSQVLNVTDLTRQIKARLEGRFAQVWVRGEVSNLRRQSSGHVYFSLKDAGSQLPCVLFARDAMRQTFELQEGMELILLGDLSVYEPHGRYQLITKIAIESGLGRLQVEFERLKRKLASEGLFDRERKRALPTHIQRIAVISSPTGAAIRDFLQILKRRDFCGEVVLFPARVQGREAPGEIKQMLDYAAASQPAFDLIVLTRGGGSIEDLWAFNDETLARAVAACPVPVISAVGHEIDHVLTDYAADERSETPSGAAERISSLYLDTLHRIEAAAQNLSDSVNRQLTERQHHLRDLRARAQILAPERQLRLLEMRLDDTENRLKASLKDRIAREQRRIAECKQAIATHHPRNRLQLVQGRLKAITHRFTQSQRVQLHAQAERLEQLHHRLESNSVQATLQRGYALIQRPEGTIVDSAQQAAKEVTLTARFHDGSVQLTSNPDS